MQEQLPKWQRAILAEVTHVLLMKVLLNFIEKKEIS